MAKKPKKPVPKSKPAKVDPRRKAFEAALRDVATSAALNVEWPDDPQEFAKRLDDVWNSDVSGMVDEIGDPLGLVSDPTTIAKFEQWIREDRAKNRPAPANLAVLDAALAQIFATPAFKKVLVAIPDERAALDVWVDYSMNYLLPELKKVLPAKTFTVVRKQWLSDISLEERAANLFRAAWQARN